MSRRTSLRHDLTDALSRALGRALDIDDDVSHEDLDVVRDSIVTALRVLRDLRHKVDAESEPREVESQREALAMRMVETAAEVFIEAVALERNVDDSNGAQIAPLHWVDALTERVKAPTRAQLPRLVLLSLIGITAYRLPLNFGQRTVDPGVASLLIQVSPIITALWRPDSTTSPCSGGGGSA